jgi:quercetin dioxygenase-like cupin family protein
VNRSSATTIRLGAISIDFLVDADASGGSVTVFTCAVPAAARVPVPHSHDGFEETIYGLEGACTFMIDGHSRTIGPGDSVCIRRGQVHGFENLGEIDATFLAIATPGVFGPSYFRDVSDAIAAGPPDPSAIAAIMRRHGLTPAPFASVAA